MAANITDLLTQATLSSRPSPTQVTSVRVGGGTTLQCNALTGWPTATAVHFITYKVDTSGNKLAGTQIDMKGVVSGTSLTNIVIKAGTDSGNAVGDIVEASPTAAWANDVVTWGTGHANQDGSLIASAVNTAIANATITSSKLATGASTSSVATTETTASTSYTALATAGPVATVTIGANLLALVTVTATTTNSTALGFAIMSFVVSGASTITASDIRSLRDTTPSANQTTRFSATYLLTSADGLTAGSNTFTAQYKALANTASFANRNIIVVPL